MTSDVGVRAELVRLLTKHGAGLYGYILACVRNHEDARHILQNVALAFTQGSGRFPSEQEFLARARETARAKVLAHPRARPLDPALVQRLAEASQRVQTMRPASDYQAALLSCLEMLPARSRLLLAMRHEGSVGTMDELAKRLDRTVPAAYTMLKQVKSILRDCVERRGAARFDHGIARPQ